MTALSAVANSLTEASYISCAERTSIRRTPVGVGSDVRPLMSTTSAPRRASASAMAYPILPVEWFEMNRTGSMASMVAPAVTLRRLPRRLFFFSERRASTNATMSVGSAMRPLPESPLASSPSAGSTIRTPRLRRIRRFSCVAECANMSRSIAGATATGQRAER